MVWGYSKMSQRRVLFICVHNSGRSQMAEAFLRHISKDSIRVESAGLEPRPVNPLVVTVMQEIGIDISGAVSNDVFEFFKQGRLFDYVVTVCDETNDAKCPVFPGITQRLHWPFPDPEGLTGTEQEKLVALRKIRDQIKAQVEIWYGRIQQN
jgi:arsenate reductase